MPRPGRSGNRIMPSLSIPNGLVLEFDQNPNGLRDELLKEPIRIDNDGMIRLPERPGLGIELDPEAVERYRSA